MPWINGTTGTATAKVARDNGVRSRAAAPYAAGYPGSPGSVDRINADAARATIPAAAALR